jgi:hypothetical protein
MSPQPAHATYLERRRSTRLPIRLALVICGEGCGDGSGEKGKWQEQTCSFSLNAHGVLVLLAATMAVGQILIIQNPENWAERRGRVTRVGRCYAGRTEVGIEFTEPAPDFWLIPAGSERVNVGSESARPGRISMDLKASRARG